MLSSEQVQLSVLSGYLKIPAMLGKLLTLGMVRVIIFIKIVNYYLVNAISLEKRKE